MNEIIETRKLEIENQLRRSIIDKSLIEERIDQMSKNVEDIDKNIIGLRAILMELDLIGQQMDQKKSVV